MSPRPLFSGVFRCPPIGCRDHWTKGTSRRVVPTLGGGAWPSALRGGRVVTSSGRDGGPARGSAGRVSLALGVDERLVDSPAQGLGHPVLAAVGDDLTEIGLEVEGVEARGALVEVALDHGPALVGQLAVEIVVEPFHGL